MEKKKNIKVPRRKLKISDVKRGQGADVGHMLSRIKAREVQLTFYCVFICLVIILVSSYLVFSTVREPKIYNNLRVGRLEVSFHDTKLGLGDVVNLTNVLPVSDQEATNLEPYIVTIKNHSSKEQSFNIKLVEDEAMIKSDGCQNQLVNTTYLKYQIDGKKASKILTSTDSFTLLSSTLKPKEKKTYRVQIWIRDDIVLNAHQSHFHSKLIITV